VIVLTVTLYGLSAAPVARRLGVVRPARTRPLLVGGDPWVIDLGKGVVAPYAGGETLFGSRLASPAAVPRYRTGPASRRGPGVTRCPPIPRCSS